MTLNRLDLYSLWSGQVREGIGASGTAKLGPGGTDSPFFCMGQDCLWENEEQQREWTAQLICSSLHSGTRLPLERLGAPFSQYNSTY